MAAGVMQMDEQMEGAPLHWAVSFAVDNCEATVAKAEELGAEVFVDSTNAPRVGIFAVLRDPQGATFNIIAMIDADPMP